jgi:hypothetical protein
MGEVVMRMVYVLRISLLLMFDWFCMMRKLALGGSMMIFLALYIFFLFFSSLWELWFRIPSFAAVGLWAKFFSFFGIYTAGWG